MDFSFTPEQQSLANSATTFCSRKYGFEQRGAALATNDGFSRDTWQVFADLGWLGAGLSEDDGGFGGSAIENMILAEAFGRALVVEPFLSCAVLSLQTLSHLPGNEICDNAIAEIVAGERLYAFAHGKPAARGDVDHVRTLAVSVNGEWRITGHKQLVLGAPSADVLLVSASNEQGVGLFLVSPKAAGISTTAYRTLDNMRASDVEFDDVVAEAVALPGQASLAIRLGHDHAITALCAEAVGAMDAAILLTRDYIKTRQQFGVALSSFQALQHRMAEMLVELELSRSILFQGIASLNQSYRDRIRAISAMKIVVSSAAMFVGRNAVQLHGGIGMTEEYSIGHYYRRLFVIAGLFGGESYHLERLAAHPAPFWPATGS